MKSYTDLEQSKKLAEILSPESADYCWGIDDETLHYNNSPYPCAWKDYTCKEYYIPCWSLAALLSVLPNNENISTNLSKGGYRISTLEYTNSWFVDYEDETNGLNNCVTSADNPVDACVDMILKLNELKML